MRFAPQRPVTERRQKSRLNCSILDQGWGSFQTLLAYKLAWRDACDGRSRLHIADLSDYRAVDRQSRDKRKARVRLPPNAACAHTPTETLPINIRDTVLGIRAWNRDLAARGG
jgi:hypothetical protein